MCCVPLCVGRMGSHGGVMEVWEDGFEYKALAAELAQLAERKDQLEKQKKESTKQLKQRGGASGKASAAGTAGPSDDGDDLPDLDSVVLDEAIKVQIAEVKKYEGVLAKRKETLDGEKALLMLELRRVRDEDGVSPCRREIAVARWELLHEWGYQLWW